MKRSRSWFFLFACLAATAIHSAPSDALLSNEISGLLLADDKLWVMSSKGLNLTFDDGLTWKSYDTSHGLGSGYPGPGTLISAQGRTLVSTFNPVGSTYSGTGIAQFDSQSGRWTNTNFQWKDNGLGKAGWAASAGDSLFLFAYGLGGILARDLRADSGWTVRVPDTSGRTTPMKTADFPPDSFMIVDSAAPGMKSLMPRYAVWAVAIDTTGSDPARIYAGTSDGLFFSSNRCSSWSRMPLPHNGDCVVLGIWVQKLDDSAAIWIALQETDRDGSSHPKLLRGLKGEWTLVEGIAEIPTDVAFWGEAVWAATGTGLYRIRNSSIVQRPSYFESRGLFQKTKTGFNAVKAGRGEDADTVLWVGASNGLFRSSDAGATWDSPIRISPAVQSGLRKVYAAPNLLDYNTNFVTFVYNLENSAKTTIEVFDSNMDKVKTIIRDQPRSAGISTPNGRSTRDFEDRWDGTNSRGQRVAIGTYFFRVKTDKGEKGFGQIVVAR